MEEVVDMVFYPSNEYKPKVVLLEDGMVFTTSLVSENWKSFLVKNQSLYEVEDSGKVDWLGNVIYDETGIIYSYKEFQELTEKRASEC